MIHIPFISSPLRRLFLILGQNLLNPLLLPLVTTSRNLSVDTGADPDIARDSWRAELVYSDVTVIDDLGDFRPLDEKSNRSIAGSLRFTWGRVCSRDPQCSFHIRASCIRRRSSPKLVDTGAHQETSDPTSMKGFKTISVLRRFEARH